ncbi:hypothetical protein L1887_39744 [Cichorium endivia]|nr:hypothetical protein L1887_39744 [Cichorium endivia]
MAISLVKTRISRPDPRYQAQEGYLYSAPRFLPSYSGSMDRSAKVLILISFFFLSVASNLNLVDAGCKPQPGACDPFYGPQSPVINLTPENFKCTVLDSKKVVLVQFYAPWCPPCKTLKPEYEKAATTLQGKATLTAIDGDAYPAVFQDYPIKGYPTVKCFVPGKPPIDYTGAREEQAIVAYTLEQVKCYEAGGCQPGAQDCPKK